MLVDALPLITAAGLSLVLCVPLRTVARRYGWVSRRDPARAGPGGIPLLGGVAVLVGLAVGVVLAVLLGLPRSAAGSALGPLPILLVLGFGAVGLADDRLRLPPLLRLGLELGIAVLALGLVAPHPWPAGVSATRIWVGVGITAIGLTACGNAVNMADNADGVAAGAGMISALGLALGWADAHSAILLSAAGALLGLLLWNLPPARIYLGDVGTLPIGALLGWGVLVRLAAGGSADLPLWTQILCAALIAGYLLFDFVYVLIGRLARGQPPWRGGTDHPTHRLRALLADWRRGWAMLLLAQVLSAAIAVAVLRAWLPAGVAILGLLIWLGLLLAVRRTAPGRLARDA